MLCVLVCVQAPRQLLATWSAAAPCSTCKSPASASCCNTTTPLRAMTLKLACDTLAALRRCVRLMGFERSLYQSSHTSMRASTSPGLPFPPLLSHATHMPRSDTEEWGEVCIGCAGGGDTTVEVPVRREPAPAGLTAFTVSTQGHPYHRGRVTLTVRVKVTLTVRVRSHLPSG